MIRGLKAWFCGFRIAGSRVGFSAGPPQVRLEGWADGVKFKLQVLLTRTCELSKVMLVIGVAIRAS